MKLLRIVLPILFALLFGNKSYSQTLTDHNTFEGVLATKNVINIFSKSWDTVYKYTYNNYFYIDSNCSTKQPRYCLVDTNNAIQTLLSYTQKNDLLKVLSDKKTYLSSQKISPDIIETNGCNNDFEYNTLYVFKNQKGNTLLLFCAEKENNFSLLYQESRISYSLWNSCINHDAHAMLFHH